MSSCRNPIDTGAVNFVIFMFIKIGIDETFTFIVNDVNALDKITRPTWYHKESILSYRDHHIVVRRSYYCREMYESM